MAVRFVGYFRFMGTQCGTYFMSPFLRQEFVGGAYFFETFLHRCVYTVVPPVFMVYRGPKKKGQIKEINSDKFQNARQARTGRNMVKSSSPNAPNT
jgi:hypothetical protein